MDGSEKEVPGSLGKGGIIHTLEAVANLVLRVTYIVIIWIVASNLYPHLGDITRIKLGDNEVNFSDQQKGNDDAIQLKLTSLERKVNVLAENMGGMSKGAGSSFSLPENKEKELSHQKLSSLFSVQFWENSKYTVLVFHQAERSQLSKTIVEAILQEG